MSRANHSLVTGGENSALLNVMQSRNLGENHAGVFTEERSNVKESGYLGAYSTVKRPNVAEDLAANGASDTDLRKYSAGKHGGVKFAPVNSGANLAPPISARNSVYFSGAGDVGGGVSRRSDVGRSYPSHNDPRGMFPSFQTRQQGRITRERNYQQDGDHQRQLQEDQGRRMFVISVEPLDTVARQAITLEPMATAAS